VEICFNNSKEFFIIFFSNSKKAMEWRLALVRRHGIGCSVYFGCFILLHGIPDIHQMAWAWRNQKV